MTFFNTLYFVNDKNSSFLFCRFGPATPVTHTTHGCVLSIAFTVKLGILMDVVDLKVIGKVNHAFPLVTRVLAPQLLSQEHCTDGVTGFSFRKLILIPLIIFFRDFATFFGNNFVLLQPFLIKKLLLDEVILSSC